jgi:quercetin dioxygenase-like cupin family protein
MEIRRFGIGHRREDGPPGTRGVEATPVHGDERGVVAELALRPHASLAAHSNPNLAYLLIIEGGGFVQVGDERARVAAGDAVVWPPNVVHAVSTELTPMRAIVVEFAAPETGSGGALPTAGEWPDAASGAASGGAAEPPGGPRADSLRAEGALAPQPAVLSPDRRSPEQEPW